MLEKARIFGLVLTGVSNEPFAEDIAWFRHHGKPQIYVVFELLNKLCDKVFIVCDRLQSNRVFNYYPTLVVKKEHTLEYLPVVHQFFKRNPDCGLLVAAACFPDLSGKELADFCSVADDARPSAFYDVHKQSYQPLVAYFPPASKVAIERSIAKGNSKIADFLEEVNAIKYNFPLSIFEPPGLEIAKNSVIRH